MKYILRKTITLIITLFIVSLLAFLAFQVIPGSPATAILGTSATPEKVEALEHEMGLDRPVLVQYGSWVKNFISGDWGTSYSYRSPVKAMVMEKLPATGALVVMAFLLTVVVSFPLGIAVSRREGSVFDKLVLVLDQICMSIPPVFVGILLCFLFGITLRVFTPGRFVPFSQDPGKFLAYMFFPALAVALGRIAVTVKMLRSSILEEMGIAICESPLGCVLIDDDGFGDVSSPLVVVTAGIAVVLAFFVKTAAEALIIDRRHFRLHVHHSGHQRR